MSWREARCLLALKAEIDRLWPNRHVGDADGVSDGQIGDQAHQERKSDHNPDANGVVHAMDVDKDGIPAEIIVQHIVQLGRDGDARMAGGYVIFMRRIWSAAHGWAERAYTGENAHDHHFHVSCTYNAAQDATTSWGLQGSPAHTEEHELTDDQANKLIDIWHYTQNVQGAVGGVVDIVNAIKTEVDDIDKHGGSGQITSAAIDEIVKRVNDDASKRLAS